MVHRLPYAHKPDIAADLNDWLLEEASNSEMCIPFATVHPADDVRAVVETAFKNGACGLKFYEREYEGLVRRDFSKMVFEALFQGRQSDSSARRSAAAL